MKRSSRDPRIKRKVRIRKRVTGTPERPRMTVFRSHRHIAVQLIDDSTGRTIASASTQVGAFRERSPNGTGIDAAKVVGELIAEKAKEATIEQVVFDRNGYVYHGRIKALADQARAKGLKF